jgi:DNA-binding XRE family transcriptional regulator
MSKNSLNEIREPLMMSRAELARKATIPVKKMAP